jgi:hypothetical protein
MLIMFEQFFCQAHGPTGVVSDGTICNFDFQHRDSYPTCEEIISSANVAVRAERQPPFHQ